jgi:Fic family protein
MLQNNVTRNDNEFFKLLVAHSMQQQALAYIQRLLSEARTDYNAALQSMLFQDSGRDGALIKYGKVDMLEKIQFDLRRYFDKNKS